MLRMHCLQQWYGLADEALEDALYDSQALRDFVEIDLSHESVPDATTLLKFRRRLQENNLTRSRFDEINAHLGEQGLLMRAGTIVDATIIAAPSSTKNEDKARDPEMHQTKKGNQWHFGMKAHIGVDAESGLVHWVIGRVRPGSPTEELDRLINRAKSRVRARVEHVLRRRQAAVGLRQGALPRRGQERNALVRGPGTGQHLPRACAAAGMSASEMGAKSRAAPEKAIYGPHSRQFGPSDSAS
jgi:IS5 family transposase